MVVFFTNKQIDGPFPADFKTFVALEESTNDVIDGVTYATVFRITYKSTDDKTWRASFGGADLSVSTFFGVPISASGTLQGYLQEEQTLPALSDPFPTPAIFGKAWGLKGASLDVGSVISAIRNKDTAQISALTASVFAGNDSITLSPFDDPATAGQFVRGFGGNDTMRGGNGNDRMKGDTGRDKLIGGRGSDTLSGGGGADTFIYTSYLDSRAGAANRDRITDFKGALGDRINLAAIDAVPSSSGINDAFVYIGPAAFSGSAIQGEVRFTTSGGNGLLSVNLAGGANPLAPEMQIVLTGVTTFAATHLVL